MSDRERQTRTVTLRASVAVATLVAIAGAPVYTLTGLVKVRHRQADLASNLSQDMALLADLGQAQSSGEFAVLAESVLEFEDAIPSTPRNHQVGQALRVAAEGCGFRIRSIDFGDAEIHALAGDTRFRSQRLRIVGSGAPSAAGAFVDALQQLERLIVMDGITLRAPEIDEDDEDSDARSLDNFRTEIDAHIFFSGPGLAAESR